MDARLDDQQRDDFIRVFNEGGVFAYPTESCYGLGCDPNNPAAVARILALKGRAVSKGLILIGCAQDQFDAFVRIPEERRAEIDASWPGPVTWLLPRLHDQHGYLSGDSASIAVRVTAHSLAASLCRVAGSALVSTSANPQGQPPATSVAMLEAYFGGRLDGVVEGALGGDAKPSRIIDADSGKIIRP